MTNMNEAPDVCFVFVSLGLVAAITVNPSPPRRTGSTRKSPCVASLPPSGWTKSAV
jgi:hypothetical protein